jgi:uncharacterized protein (TIGR03437 family)
LLIEHDRTGRKRARRLHQRRATPAAVGGFSDKDGFRSDPILRVQGIQLSVLDEAVRPADAHHRRVQSQAVQLLQHGAPVIGQAAAVNLDGTVNSITSPAKAGSIVSLYVTGALAAADGDGAVATTAKPGTAVQVVAGNPYQTAAVLYAGPSPGTISAVTQINVQLPAGVIGDHVPIYFLEGGLSSQSGMTLAVK